MICSFKMFQQITLKKKQKKQCNIQKVSCIQVNHLILALCTKGFFFFFLRRKRNFLPFWHMKLHAPHINMQFSLVQITLFRHDLYIFTYEFWTLTTDCLIATVFIIWLNYIRGSLFPKCIYSWFYTFHFLVWNCTSVETGMDGYKAFTL